MKKLKVKTPHITNKENINIDFDIKPWADGDK